MRFLPTAYVVRREGYILTRVCLTVRGGGGVPQSGPDGGRVPQPCPDRGVGYPSQVQMGGVPWPGQDGGYPRWWYHPRQGWGTPQPGQDGGGYPRWGYPLPGMYPLRYRTADGVLDTPRSVCLLRSRRRTFLFSKYFSFLIFPFYQLTLLELCKIFHPFPLKTGIKQNLTWIKTEYENQECRESVQ